MVVHEIERLRDPVLLVGHQGIIRVLYAYFMGMDREKCPFLSVPLNHVIKLTPGTYSCEEEKFQLLDSKKDPDAPSC